MIIRVKVQTRASFERVEETGLDEYKVWVTAGAHDNQANEALIDVLSDFFDIPVSRIRIKSGNKSTNKLIELE